MELAKRHSKIMGLLQSQRTVRVVPACFAGNSKVTGWVEPLARSRTSSTRYGEFRIVNMESRRSRRGSTHPRGSYARRPEGSR
jgi:hypothetical protein